ncbi:MAG: DUF3347 domain-containing protein [Cyclobacteriaceae bacterium]|nr:DUF3347 domain-containing protein [Cyclobacteriaceae bacterium]
MNFKNKTLTFVLAAGMSLNLAACGQTKSNETDHSGHDHLASKEENVNMESGISKQQAQKILSAYLKIKDALVETDGVAASSAAKELLPMLADSEDDLIKKLKSDAEHIMDSKDAAHQRDHFNILSDNVYALLKSTSANENTIYRQYCPMAMSNSGAFWLSAEKEINNPYFGDKMLHCGSVKEEL